MTDAFTTLVSGMQAGATWELMGQAEPVKALLEQVFDERIHRNDWATYQLRANLQKKPDVASYAGFIVDEGNPTSGPYQGTSFVWFPGNEGSVVALVIGTDGFGADTAILGRPGHRRRLRALSRLHSGRLAPGARRRCAAYCRRYGRVGTPTRTTRPRRDPVRL